MSPDIILRNYPAQNYKVIFDRSSGFLARVEEQGHEDPFWAQKGPELLDISITSWCDKGCKICYRNSNVNGKHMPIDDYKYVIQEASRHNVLQVALGGGNPNQHPNFIEILEITKEKYGIVPSYTTNGRGLTVEILEASEKYCGAVAVSAHEPYSEMAIAINKLHENNVKVNIHFVLDQHSIQTAINWLNKENEYLRNCNALIFLNYKPVGANKEKDRLLKNSSSLMEFFQLVEDKKRGYKIGFDSCMVSGIVRHMKKVNDCFIEPCDSGRFSAFVSEDLSMYPCSFMIDHYKGESLKNKSFMEIWESSDLFTKIRNNLDGNRCAGCSTQKLCFNGCPFLSEINLC